MRHSIAVVACTGITAAVATAQSTVFLRDIYPGNSSSVDPGGPASSFNGQLYFSAWEPVTGSELWRTDGTLSGTLPFADIVPGPGSSHPFPVALGAELLVFSDDGGIFNVLKTDGTPGNLTFITSLGTSSGGCDPRDWRLVSGPNAFFRFASAAGGCELWKSDGTAAGTALVKDIEVGAAGSNPGSAFDDGGRLVFVASTGAAGAEPWVSDGTSGGTAMIADVNPGPAASGTSSFTAMGGQIYFSASTPHGLWKTDLSPAGTTLVAPIYLDPGTNRICNANGTLLFAANSGPQAKHELWKSDGTPAGTVFVKDLCPQSSSDPRDFFTIGGVALFVASGYTMDELWRSDGTVGGTYAVKDLTPESTSAAKAAGVVNGRLLFAARDALHGGELWLSDGTDTGTFLIGDIDPTTDPIAPSFVGAVGGQAIVASNNNPPTGREPWRTSLACLDVTPVQLPHATLGQPYGCTLTATGGAPPYVFALTSGSLPAGLTLSASGVISGTPTEGGGFGIQVTVTDVAPAETCAGRREYALAVRHGVDILAGCGQGQTNPNEIVTTDPAGFPTGVDFLAYAAGQWGALVAAGDVDGGATDEILTGPGPGPVFGPQVRGFRSDGTSIAKINFYAYATLKYGVNVGAADLDGDPFAEILTAPGPGPTFGPHIRGWNFDGITVAPLTKVSFFAYLTLKYGANVGAGDVEGDGYDEILTGPGPGPAFGPNVRGFDYDNDVVKPISKINLLAPFSYYGCNVAGGDVDADARAEILVGNGASGAGGAGLHAIGYNYDGVSVTPLPGFVYDDGYAPYGCRVASGPLGAGGDLFLRSTGPSSFWAPSTIHVHRYSGSSLPETQPHFEAFPGRSYGAAVAVGRLGY